MPIPKNHTSFTTAGLIAQGGDDTSLADLELRFITADQQANPASYIDKECEQKVCAPQLFKAVRPVLAAS